MINLLDYYAGEHYPQVKSLHYNMVMVGAGGTGGLLVQRLAKMMFAFNKVNSRLMLADPDTVETKDELSDDDVL
ncbi:hypothetical protein WGM54_17945 [Paenibacillus polymyxa]|uniref:hypothetical protein n=1 Tax=Paenibacillus polymyxa TaxID=1406 RepID=UPI00307E2B55